MGAFIVWGIIQATCSITEAALAQQELEEKQLAQMNPEARLKTEASFHKDGLKRQKEISLSYDYERVKKELNQRYIDRKTKQLEMESRAAYPDAWRLSDWVDEVGRMLDEEGQYNPIPRLTNNEN
jgi:hypothetical protein